MNNVPESGGNYSQADSKANFLPFQSLLHAFLLPEHISVLSGHHAPGGIDNQYDTSETIPLTDQGGFGIIYDHADDIISNSGTSNHINNAKPGNPIILSLEGIDSVLASSPSSRYEEDDASLSPLRGTMGSYVPKYRPRGREAPGIRGGGHFQPARLDAFVPGSYQYSGNNSMDALFPPWTQESIVKTTPHTTIATPTPIPQILTAPAGGQLCQCPYFHPHSLPSHVETLYPGINASMQSDNSEEFNNDWHSAISLRRRQRADFATLRDALTRDPSYAQRQPSLSPKSSDESDASTQAVAPWYEDQGMQSPLMTAEKLDEVLKALEDGKDDEYGSSVLLKFLQPTNTTATNTKNVTGSPRNQGKGPQTYTCLFNHCRKRLERKDRALGHVRMHLGYRPYICNGRCGVDGCREAFACHSYLKSHRQRPKETCSKCGLSLFKKDFPRHAVFCHVA
ncbi:hypothetical protein FRC14_003159 [Serendipita sp. 396]|nr:hypothetical protein FRC14_003159 [Serendipita sp. 396]KAG8783934.1 hypothetical protein FRC15_004276 [Serendipita sp. 397]KAG8800061.1 hypothetical protein FRC16_003796 [Serendipita sp. 398]KAG8868163.1 hypothetical protein FRC20_004026 [Serendipita sp. 405]